jgi:hypothetical protein
LETQPNRWFAAVLAKRSGEHSDAAHIADATISVWQDIATALHSIIGRQGVAALYERSISLTARTHAWLAHLRAGADYSIDMDALQAVIARQSVSDASVAAGELLQTFYSVLVGLIGPALCEQLLLPARETPAPAAMRSVSYE